MMRGTLVCVLLVVGTLVPAAALGGAPGNDDFANADDLGGVPAFASQSTEGATTELLEPEPCAGIGATVWFTFTVQQYADLRVHTNGSDYDTAIAVYRGDDLIDLDEVGCDDDGGHNLTSVVEFYAAENETYRIQAGGFEGAVGHLELTVEEIVAEEIEPPANDAFADAEAAPALPFTIERTTEGATAEPDEPRPCGEIGATVWFVLTVGEAADVRLDTDGSDFDTVLAVYTGDALAELAEVACDDQGGANNTSVVEFEAAANGTYRIQAGGFVNATGNLVLSGAAIEAEPDPVAPHNDLFAEAEAIAGTPFFTQQSTAGASREPGEPQPCADIGSTVWFVFDAAEDAVVHVDTNGSDYDTALAVHLGNELADLEEVACDDDGGPNLTSVVEFRAVAGERYYLQAGGFGNASGELTLSIVELAPAPNDAFANALPLAVHDTLSASTLGATTEPGEPAPCADIGATVWYRLEHEGTSVVTLETEGSDYDTVLAVYTGDGLDDLVNVACDDDGGPDLASRATFLALQGVAYYVQVGGFGGDSGHLVLNSDALIRLPELPV